MRHALILTGGSGTWLWPFSTRALPKQLVPLLQGRLLLDVAVERATSVLPAERVWLGAGENLRSAVQAIAALRQDRLVVEPSGRDTLAAVALGCAVISRHDPDAVVAVLTAEHVISPASAFASILESAFALAESGDVPVTFGVGPDQATTASGHLELRDRRGSAQAARRRRHADLGTVGRQARRRRQRSRGRAGRELQDS